MKGIIPFTIILSIFTVHVFSGSIITPVFPHKDGEVSATGFLGSENDILVDGSANQVIGWIAFQTSTIDFSGPVSSQLTLYVKSLDMPGTLQVHGLTKPITNPENNVSLSDIEYAPTPTMTVLLGTDDIEKILMLDITALCTTNTFFGIALTSIDGMRAIFDSKEGNLSPLILLTHNVKMTSDKWYNGVSVPDAGLGKNNDMYLNSSTGDVYSKTAGTWNLTMNIRGGRGASGVKGEKGDTGEKGEKGDPGAKGDKGDTGPQGIKGDIGLKGPKGEAGQSFIWRGIWSADSSYVFNDVVFHDGSAYLAITGSSGQIPSNNSNWNMIASKGDKGSEGLMGPKGDKGDIGPAGSKGDKGEQGEKGDKGPKGDKGDPGSGDAHSLDAYDGTPVDQVYVDSDGNVGIRTTEPTEEVEIKGNAKISNIYTESGRFRVTVNETGYDSIYINMNSIYIVRAAWDGRGNVGTRAWYLITYNRGNSFIPATTIIDIGMSGGDYSSDNAKYLNLKNDPDNNRDFVILSAEDTKSMFSLVQWTITCIGGQQSTILDPIRNNNN